MNRRDELSTQLQLQEALFRIYKSQDFQEFALPIFEKAVSNNQWPDPSLFPTKEEFLKKYEEEFYKTFAYKKILKVFKGSEDVIHKIRAELDKPERAVGIK